MFTPEYLLELLQTGWLTTVPLGIGSVLTIGIFIERFFRFRGVESKTRAVASEVIEALRKGDLGGARSICEASDTPAAGMLGEALLWKNVAVEDLERVLATLRAEMNEALRSRLWIIGTVGSLAPFVGLFGTVIGIIRAFADMAEHGSGGFAVVANGIAEALVATALGLGVAIVALMLFNYLQTRASAIAGTYARAAERLVQALLYVESTQAGDGGAENGDLVSA